jgi:transposase
VPVDVGKNVNWFAVYAGFELAPQVEPRKVRTTRAGLAQLTHILDDLLTRGSYKRIVLGMEPTGVYHENWARALEERYHAYRTAPAQPHFDFRFINPVVVKRRRSTLHGGRPRSTDPIALQAIALCLRDDLGYPASLSQGDGGRFAGWAQDYRQSQRRRRRLEIALRAQIDRLWPGLLVNVDRFAAMHPDMEPPVPLVTTRPLTRKSIQAILQHCPNPHQFLALDVEGIQAFFRHHVGRCGLKTARKAYRVVAQAVLPPPDIAAWLASQLQTQVAHYYYLADHIADLHQQVDSLVPDSPAAVVTTVPGLGNQLAARYLAYLKHHRRFQRAAEIWAHAGFDLVTSESGDYRRLGQITKKGHPGLRDTLYLMGLNVAQQVPAIARTKARAKKRGKGEVGATLHAAHRVNRICHRLLYDQVPYAPDQVR